MNTIIDGIIPLNGWVAAERYVDLLTGSVATTSLNFRTFGDSKACKSPAQNLTGTLEELKPAFDRAQAERCGVFAVVNGGGQTDAEIAEVRAVFIDADKVPLEGMKWHVTPDFLVYRDDTHWHAYWLMGELGVGEFSLIQRRLAKHYRTDPSVNNPSRVMRLPGYMHQKDPAHPMPVTLIDLTGGMLGDQIRSWNAPHTLQTISIGLPELSEETADATRTEGTLAPFRGRPIPLEKFREMLSYIDPTMKGEHGKWAGMTLAIVHGQIPLLNSDGVNGIELADEFNSGELWRRRTHDQDFEVRTYVDREEMLRSAAGKPREAGPVITLGTFYIMAKEGGYQGPPVDEMAAFDALNETKASEASAKVSPDLFPAYFVSELDALPDPTWLIEDLVEEDALCIHYGATGSLKTFLALDIVLSGAVLSMWADGEEGQAAKMHGYKIARPLRAAFIAGEGARGLRKRIRAWQKKHGMTSANIPVAVIPTMPSFADPKGVDKLIRTIRAKLKDVDIVVVDTMMRASSGLNLNIPADAQTLIDACEHIRQELVTSVLLIHHTGKDRDRGMLGAENLKAAVHMVERIDLVDSSSGQRTISITQEKAKDSDLRDRPIYMQAKLEYAGVDAEGNGVSSLVLSRCAVPTPVKANMDGLRFQAALGIIRDSGGQGILMRPLAEGMAKSLAGGKPLEGEALEKQTEAMRKWVESETRVGGKLTHLASRVGTGDKAPWRFCDQAFAAILLAAE